MFAFEMKNIHREANVLKVMVIAGSEMLEKAAIVVIKNV
jgi:hypothetical protein